jgi:hypothetical protein
MTDYDNTEEITEKEQQEMDLLKARADQLNIKYHPNIGLGTLRERVNTAVSKPDKIRLATKVLSRQELVNRELTEQRNKAKRLVRIMITCMDPSKSNIEGEIHTVSNRVVGTVRRYVPCVSEAWHVEHIIYEQLKEKKFVHHYTIKDSNNKPVNKQKLVPTYNVAIIDNMSDKEIDELKKQQALAGRIE